MSDKEINKGHDQAERFNRSDRTSENTSKDSVISGDRKDHQAMHKEASKAGHTFDTFSDNNHDQSFKAIQPAADTFGIDFGDGIIETSKGKVAKPHTKEFFEAKAQNSMKAFQNLDQQPNYSPDQVIAANVTPNVPRIETTSDYREIQSDASGIGTDAISWKNGDVVDSLKAPLVLLPDYLIGDLVEKFGDIQKAIDSLPENPLRGHEVEAFNQTTKDDPLSWSHAKAQFPELKDVSPDVLKAITLNEIHFYDKLDLSQDVLASSSTDALVKKAVDDKTLGMSQITPIGLRDMCSYFPQLKAFMTEKGYIGNEQKALLDPSCIPMIVAAKAALIVRDLNRHHIPVNTDTIAYSYNADVYSYSDGHGGKVYKCLQNGFQVNTSRLQHWDQVKEYYANDPKVTQESIHLRNVKEWLKTPTNAQ